MATIELSAGMMTGLPARIIRTNEGGGVTVATAGLLMQGSDSYGVATGRIAIMKGTVPTDLSSLITWASRSTDALVVFDPRAAHFPAVQQNVNPAVISTIYVAATGSGTATWFWWTVRPTYAFDNPNNIYHQIIGTVGTTGSGADLEITSTNITSGELYRIVNFRMSFPSTWVY